MQRTENPTGNFRRTLIAVAAIAIFAALAIAVAERGPTFASDDRRPHGQLA